MMTMWGQGTSLQASCNPSLFICCSKLRQKHSLDDLPVKLKTTNMESSIMLEVESLDVTVTLRQENKDYKLSYSPQTPTPTTTTTTTTTTPISNSTIYWFTTIFVNSGNLFEKAHLVFQISKKRLPVAYVSSTIDQTAQTLHVQD